MTWMCCCHNDGIDLSSTTSGCLVNLSLKTAWSILNAFVFCSNNCSCEVPRMVHLDFIKIKIVFISIQFFKVLSPGPIFDSTQQQSIFMSCVNEATERWLDWTPWCRCSQALNHQSSTPSWRECQECTVPLRPLLCDPEKDTEQIKHILIKNDGN